MTPERQPRHVRSAVAAMLRSNPRMPAQQVAQACGCPVTYVVRMQRDRQRRPSRKCPRWRQILTDPKNDAEEEISQLMHGTITEILRDFRQLVREKKQNARTS